MRYLAASVVLGLLVMLTSVDFAKAQEGPDLAKLVDVTIDIDLSAGKPLKNMEVVKIVPGTLAGSVRAMTVRPAGTTRQQVVNAAAVRELFLSGEPLDVTYDRKDRSLVHDAEKRSARLAEVARVTAQLQSRRARLWAEIAEADRATHTDEIKKFAEETISKAGLTTQLVETKYFVFYTDMDPNTVGVYVRYLDAMYDHLCKGFDVPEGKNIWKGKCAVVAVQKSSDFTKVEVALNNMNSQGAQGICHNYGDGRVLITCYKGSSVEFFATVLVHETAHGFVHRYKSTVHVPPWINEGIADWVAGSVVKADTEVKRRQNDAMDRLRQAGSLNPEFFTDTGRLESWEYGLASSLVELMLRIDAKKYRKFFDGVKEGLPPDESLKQSYGLTFADLVQRYSQAAKLPALKF